MCFIHNPRMQGVDALHPSVSALNTVVFMLHTIVCSLHAACRLHASCMPALPHSVTPALLYELRWVMSMPFSIGSLLTTAYQQLKTCIPICYMKN